MEEKEFNLLDEPWIRVMDENCVVTELSLTDTLLRAHQFHSLAGELATQDVAVLRLLLAVLHTVFSRVDKNGDPVKMDDVDDVLDQWESLWKLGQFPEDPIRDYLAEQHENFWLFHPERPFWQTPAAKSGTEYGAAKLNGELSESTNKLKLFSNRAGNEKNTLTYGEAARWLLYVNAFDDTSAKPKIKGLPSPGAGWLGKLGLISAVGETLFESLMLNLVLLRDGETPWERARPCWERKTPKADERTEIAIPDNAAELLTMQSRRLLLQREGLCVTGYFLLGGDFFQKENAFSEQMTKWGRVPQKGNAPIAFQPRRHDSSRQMWRDFAQIFVSNEENKQPGIVCWVKKLNDLEMINHKTICQFRIDSVQYGDKDFFVSDVFSDSIRFHTNLLTELGQGWQTHICNEIQSCDKAAYEIGHLASNLCIAAGGTLGAQSDRAKQQFYSRLDIPFRQWLESLDSEDTLTSVAKKQREWQKTARQIAYQLGSELANAAGEAAFRGRMLQEKKEKSEPRFYSTVLAFNWFTGSLYKIYPKKEGE